MTTTARSKGRPEALAEKVYQALKQDIFAFRLMPGDRFSENELAGRLAAGNRGGAIVKYVDAAKRAKEVGLGLNAGHDLDLHNLKYFKQNIPWLDEVSIGHALICDAIYLGFENAIQLYKRQLAE